MLINIIVTVTQSHIIYSNNNLVVNCSVLIIVKMIVQSSLHGFFSLIDYYLIIFSGNGLLLGLG